MCSGVDFITSMPGPLNSLIGLPRTEIVTLVDTKFRLICSLLLRRLGLPVLGKKSTPLLSDSVKGI